MQRQVPLPPATTRRHRPDSGARQAQLTAGLVATVVFLTAIAPLATDMYVPAFPQVAGDLAATATQVQLTLTTFFVGMALGQLVGGPVSDQRGRRTPLLAAVAGHDRGLGRVRADPDHRGDDGGPVRPGLRRRLGDGDRPGGHRRPRPGARLVRVLNVIAGGRRHRPDRRPAARRGHPPAVALAGLVLGGRRRSAWPWPSPCWSPCPETLPPERRHGGGLRHLRRSPAGRSCGNRRYVGYLVVAGSAMGALFAYVATSAFVLQSMNGLSPDRVLDRLRRQRRRDDGRRPGRRPARRSGRHPRGHPGRPGRRAGRRRRDAGRRALVRHAADAGDRSASSS